MWGSKVGSTRIFVDETSLKLQEKIKCKTAYLWAVNGSDPNCNKLKKRAYANPPLVYYHFSPNRNHQNLEELIGENYKGFLHSDHYGAYIALDKKNDHVTWQPCWVHARRNFINLSSYSRTKDKVIELIDTLFEKEREAWAIEDKIELSHTQKLAQRLEFRKNNCAAIVNEILVEIENLRNENLIIVDKDTLQAINYITKHKANFLNFLNHPELRIDNNSCERVMRPITVGRKNWLFAGSEKGGEAMAILQSLIQTCRNLSINPEKYLEDILRRINNTAPENLAELLPQNWEK